jgi:hypothetical protein
MSVHLHIYFVVETATGIIEKTVERDSQPLPLATRHFVLADNVTLTRYNLLVEALPAILLTDVQF